MIRRSPHPRMAHPILEQRQIPEFDERLAYTQSSVRVHRGRFHNAGIYEEDPPEYSIFPELDGRPGDFVVNGENTAISQIKSLHRYYANEPFHQPIREMPTDAIASNSGLNVRQWGRLREPLIVEPDTSESDRWLEYAWNVRTPTMN